MHERDNKVNEVKKAIGKIEKKRKPNDRKTAEALKNLKPLLFEILAEDKGSVGSQGYHVELEDDISQKDPKEDRETTYRNACNTLRSQGYSMEDVVDALVNDPRLITALRLGQITNPAYQMIRGELNNALADYFPGAKRQENKSERKSPKLK